LSRHGKWSLDKRAITIGEHSLIIGREWNPELRDFYELCWHLRGSQSDIANLRAENIDWNNRVIADRVAGAGQPFFVAAKLIQYFGGEKLRAIARWRSKWFQKAGGDQHGNLMWLKAEKPGLSVSRWSLSRSLRNART